MCEKLGIYTRRLDMNNLEECRVTSREEEISCEILDAENLGTE